MTTHIKSKLLGLLAGMAAIGCNPDDEKVFKSPGNTETKPTATLLSSLQGGAADANGGKKPATEAASVTYIVRIKTNSGIDFCEGTASLKIMSDLNVKVPEAKVQCSSVVIDLGSILGGDKGLTGGADTGAAAAGDKAGLLAHDGHIFYIKELMGTKFSGNGRPMLLGPLVQNNDKYKNFKKSVTTTVSGLDPVTKAPVSGDATFNVEVINHKTTYKNKYIDKGFDSILHWKVEATADEKLPPSLGLVFEKWEWLYNTNPIMIPQIEIVANLKNFISDPNSSSDLVGKITLTLLVKEYSMAE